jgi:hypothetical protein
MKPLRRLKRHALGINLPAFVERRSHLEAIRAGDRRQDGRHAVRPGSSNIRSECGSLNMRSRKQTLKQGLKYFVDNPASRSLPRCLRPKSTLTQSPVAFGSCKELLMLAAHNRELFKTRQYRA